ncbi:hypothetical protein UA08_07986 [Talaromyces atroroseus]|uniref:FAD-binding FR-type domain-containing protein n=1 Tax=Talaromyces atroroseus TaxID=1441469 RepID=A0A225APF3_TALAT|nr:hypothetical protein UA08_07986 [Talaromyces atroroseus]OKL56846.1 hypothetical protein UA08_07986 [Talaromyces atroroseus]
MVGMLHRLLQHVLRSRYTRGRKSGRLSYGLYKAMAAVYQWINTHFIIAFPLKRKILWFDLPTRIDAILVVGYWILSIMLMSITYYLSNDNIYWPDPSRQLLRYIADRTGIMSFANLFLILIFAGRNNILIWSTGWSFAKFNIFHRHVAWIATLQAVIHTLAYLTLFVRVAFIWVSDRFLRLTRVVYCNLHIRLRLGGTQTTRSTATYDPASNVVRLEVIPGSVMHQPTASSFYYLYQPFRFRGWESHPFTLGSWEHTVEDQNSHSDTIATAITEIGNDGIENSKTPLLNASISQRHTGNEDSYSDAKRILERPKLIFWIRPYNGWTRSLRDQCLDSPNRSVSPTILLEGPYGESFSLGGHEPVLLIAGGTGIACAVPYIRENLHRSKMMMSKNKNENDDSELLTHTRIHLVWASRETAFVHDVASRELRDALSHEEFHASFYITGKQQETSSSGAIASPSSSISFFSFSASSSLPNITNNLRAHDSEDNELLNLHHGRPNIQELVLQHAQDASEANYSLLVVVSGPSAMADETRAAVYLAMRRGYRRITFREDSFSW